MKGLHEYISFLIASTVFFISFTFKFLMDIISVSFFIRDIILFTGVYIICKIILKRIEIIFNLYRKVVE